MTSAENSVSEPPNLNIFWGRIPDPPYKVRAFGTPDNAPTPPPPPHNKKSSNGPAL